MALKWHCQLKLVSRMALVWTGGLAPTGLAPLGISRARARASDPLSMQPRSCHLRPTPMPADLELALGFDVPENMSRVYFSLGNVSGESLPPGEMPYNSTLWLNGSAISLSAPFLDVGHGCSGNNGSAAWATASATKGNRSLWTYLVKKGRYATRHRGTSGVSRAPYSGWGSPSRLHGWLAALFAIYGSLYGVGS